MTQIGLEYANWSVCAICYQKVNGDQFDWCAICGAEFHQIHLQTWLLVDRSCPVCRSVVQPKKRQIRLPFHVKNRVFKDSRNHDLLQVSNNESIINNKPINQLARYPIESTQAIQIGYSTIGFLDHLANLGPGLLRSWKNASVKERLASIINFILFFPFVILLVFVAMNENNIVYIIPWFVVVLLLFINLAWLTTDEDYIARINRNKAGEFDRYKL